MGHRALTKRTQFQNCNQVVLSIAGVKGITGREVKYTKNHMWLKQ